MPWNKKPFSIYTSEEQTVIKLVKELGDQTNYNTNEVDTLTETETAHYNEIKNGKINISDFTTDDVLDFKGTWKGLKPTQTNEFIQAQVDQNTLKLIENANKHNLAFINVKYPPSPYVAVNGDGTDETSKIQALITYAESMGRAVLFFPFTLSEYKITSPLEIDFSKVNILGNNCKINAKEIVGSYAIHLFSSMDYDTTHRNIITAIKGMRLIGGTYSTKFNGSGILIGHSTYTNCSNCLIESVAIEGFNNNIEFTNNAWRINLRHIYSRWGGMYANTALSNMGENINFSNCMFCDSDIDITIGTGLFHFNSCSFDNITFRAAGDIVAHFVQCHFENPNTDSHGYRYVSIDSINGTVFIDNSDIILNNPIDGGNFNKALFYVIDGNTTRGLYLSNLKLFQNSKYTPNVDDGHLLLVAGAGKVKYSGGYSTWINNFNYVVSRATNRLYNGGAEKNNTNGWTITGTGSVTIETADYIEGTKSFKLSATTGQTVTLKQKVNVSSNEIANLAYFNKRVLGGGSISTTIRAYSNDGNFISDISYSNLTSDIAWNIVRGVCGIVPIGTSYIEVIFILTGGASGSTVWLDDIIFDSF